LTKAVKEVFPRIPHAYCCQHIAANIQSQFGIAAKELFWPIACAKTKEAFHVAFQALLTKSPKAAECVENIDVTHYITWCFPRPRYGQLTSNTVESLNGSWKAIRALHPTRMLVTIWNTIMETFAFRASRHNIDSTITDKAKKAFLRRYESSRNWRVYVSSPTLVQFVSTDRMEHVVDLEKKTCTCTKFQEYQAPCSHAIVAARHQHVDPYSLFDHAYTLVCCCTATCTRSRYSP
jgi:hypothetical protein